jgi:ABC-2 type transport system ATP-binding protein
MAALSNEVVVRVEGVKHSYDGKSWALKGVDFEVRKGEVFGLLGKNGAGKSTLIKILTSLIRPSNGTVRILGMDPEREGTRIRRRIGVVQQGESFEFTSVEGNFDIYGMLWDVPKEERVARRERLLKIFDLADVRKQRAFDLSGGQKRRVQVARELMHDVDILFLDEPTVGLDVVMRRAILDFIKEEIQKGLTVVFTTHNLEEADYLCDRIAVIDEGKILALDTVDHLKKLYGGKKTIEISVSGQESTRFFARLKGSLPARDVLKDGVVGEGIILSQSPKDSLRAVLDASQETGIPIEWLNVRKDTLEDVFLETLKGGEK